jgi:hypothetical protein
VNAAEITPPVGSENLTLAAHWKQKYLRERARRVSAQATLIGVRKTRDHYRGLAEEYEFRLGIRRYRGPVR